MFDVVPMGAGRMYRDSPGFEKSIRILVGTPFANAFAGGIQTDLSCTPLMIFD